MHERHRVKVLISCEYSGTVRDAFTKLGHYAVSCDLLPSDKPGHHYQGDVFDIINDNWDLMIAHPPCTYLCNSGVRWLVDKDGNVNHQRYLDMKDASDFFKQLLMADIPKICIENPIPHKYGTTERGIRKYDQIIQPWQFGHGETKATCLWLKGLPKLVPTDIVEGRDGRIHRLPPGPERWKLRSTTYEGIARAMAEQWGREC